MFPAKFVINNVLNTGFSVDTDTVAGIFYVMAKQVETLVVGPFLVNCYLYWDDEVAEGLIIDPGDEDELIHERISQIGFKPRAILLTHGHVDHIAAVGPLKRRYDLPLYIGQGEEGMLLDPSANASAFLAEPVTAPQPDYLVVDEQELVIGKLCFRVLATPGHTAAGVCYLDERNGLLFCGDTLFQGSIGRTDLPGGSYKVLLESIDRKILTLPDSVICYPGHGPHTTVGAERSSNPFLVGGHFA